MIKKKHIFSTVLIFSAIIFLWGEKIKTIFTPILIALILTYIASPFVNMLSVRMPKILAAVLFYALIFGLCILLVAFILPTLLNALQNFISQLPSLINTLSEKLPFLAFSIPDATSYLAGRAETISDFIKNAFSFLASAVFSIVLSCFFLMDTSFMKRGFSSVFPESFTDKFIPAIREIDAIFKNFLRGQFLVSLFLTALTFILLLILRIKHALVLSVIYGIFCFIPTIGPFLGGVPIVLIAYLSSPVSAFLALASLVFTQFAENTFLSPKIKADSVDISPASAFIAVYLGAGFFGILGIIFGIPILASLKIILRRFLSTIS